MRPVCDACGTSFFTPRIACPSCHSEEWRYQPSRGLGTIYSYTVVHRAPTPAFEPPYVVADVDLDEGWHMMSNVVGIEPGDVCVGLRVAVTFAEPEPGVWLPVFVPHV